jgi:hypothetical protein
MFIASEDFDGSTVSTLGVRSWKISNVVKVRYRIGDSIYYYTPQSSEWPKNSLLSLFKLKGLEYVSVPFFYLCMLFNSEKSVLL